MKMRELICFICTPQHNTSDIQYRSHLNVLKNHKTTQCYRQNSDKLHTTHRMWRAQIGTSHNAIGMKEQHNHHTLRYHTHLTLPATVRGFASIIHIRKSEPPLSTKYFRMSDRLFTRPWCSDIRCRRSNWEKIYEKRFTYRKDILHISNLYTLDICCIKNIFILKLINFTHTH